MRRLVLAAAALAFPGPAATAQTTSLLASPSPAYFHPHHPHTHRGPGPHFIDAFFTENAYLERKIRPDFLVSSGDAEDRYTLQVEAEWAFLRNVAGIIHVPVHRIVPVVGSSETGFGDVSVGLKVAPINDRRRFILALGSDLAFPTGDQDRGLGEGHATAAPFALAWIPFGPERRWLLQLGSHVEVPLTSGHEKHAELGAAVSWTSPLGLTPIVEGLVETPLDGGRSAWAVAPEFRWEVAGGWEIGAAVRIPVAGPREENYRLAAGLIHHFAFPFEVD
jgi:hypothetical protein